MEILLLPDEKFICILRLTHVLCLPVEVYFRCGIQQKIEFLLSGSKTKTWCLLSARIYVLSLSTAVLMAWNWSWCSDSILINPVFPVLLNQVLHAQFFEPYYLSTSWINQMLTGSYVKQIKFQFHTAFARLFCHGKILSFTELDWKHIVV